MIFSISYFFIYYFLFQITLDDYSHFSFKGAKEISAMFAFYKFGRPFRDVRGTRKLHKGTLSFDDWVAKNKTQLDELTTWAVCKSPSIARDRQFLNQSSIGGNHNTVCDGFSDWTALKITAESSNGQNALSVCYEPFFVFVPCKKLLKFYQP